MSDIIYCLENNSNCSDELKIADGYFFYFENQKTGELSTIEIIHDLSYYDTNYTLIIPDYEYITKDVTINNISYKFYFEVKNIDTSFFKKFIIPLFIIVIIISSIASFFISRLFTKPIKTINKQIVELEHLNFSSTLHVNKNDELGKISNSLVNLNDVISLGISSIEAEKKKSDDFLKIMSHELKTPLTVVRGYNELLTMDSNLTHEQLENLHISIKEIDKMTSLINNNIIFVSKLDTIQNNDIFDLKELVQKEIDTYTSIYPKIRLYYQLDNVEYNTNPNILKLAIKNIVENAFLHQTQNTEIKITLNNHFFEVQNCTNNYFEIDEVGKKNSKNLGVYITLTALQLLNLKYTFTLKGNQVNFRIFL